MPETFFISDTHFGHEKTCTEFTHNGAPLRPFANADEMDEALVANWNGVVAPDDKIYVLGDVVIKKSNLDILGRLNGRKRLVRGNHDIFDTKKYIKYFDQIYGCRVFSEHGFVATHIPVHVGSLTRRAMRVNVHGHTHANNVMMTQEIGGEVPDPRYVCVCVEQINFTPQSLEDVLARAKEGFEFVA